VGYIIATVVVLVVVALVVPILLLAHKIGGQAQRINAGLEGAVVNTAGLKGLNTTISYATAIVAGLNRGRKKLGG
jgi:preprotein translocase subunit SecG